MNGFSDDWLALREPADRRARNPELVKLLKGAILNAGPRRIVDLGAGNGANLRYLLPELGHGQSWLLIDHDQSLLECVPARLVQWATDQQASIEQHGDSLCVEAAAFSATVERRPLDLAYQLASVPFSQCDFVTGSALLDLAGSQWLAALAEHCADSACVVYFSLSYDGETRWSPLEDRDEAIRVRFNRHQTLNKGLGSALGPQAADSFKAILKSKGYRLTSRTSDWVLSSGEQALQLALVDGIYRAVDEIDPDYREQTRDWLELRRRLIQERRSELRIGHTDFIGFPTNSP